MLTKQNCVIWIQSFILYIKTADSYKDIVEDLETSNNELDRPLPKGKNRNIRINEI